MRQRQARGVARTGSERDERARAGIRRRAHSPRPANDSSNSARLEAMRADSTPVTAPTVGESAPTVGEEADRTTLPPAPVETPIQASLPLGRGGAAAAARQVQERLVSHGAELDADGVFGGQTEDMVRAFQFANQIAVTGVVDAVTATLLFSGTARGIDAARLEGVPGIAIGEFETWDEGQRTGNTDVVLLDGVRLTAWLAPHWVRMRDAAQADGVQLRFNSARSGFRTSQDQAELYRRYGAPRAVPPGWSNHQDGHAIDLVMTPDVKRWMSARAGEFGFVRPTYEDWHWEYRA